MQAEERRRGIVARLQESTVPISATALAGVFSVSRQVIVGDIALLRAGGVRISATPRGYMLLTDEPGLLRQVACRHELNQAEEELDAMVDEHCLVVDVIIDHPVYGQLTGPLQLSCRRDVRQFLDRLTNQNALPLASLTEGAHLHTLLCPSEEAFQRVLSRLRELHVLLEA